MNMVPAPAITFAAPSPAIEYVARAPTVTVALAPAVTCTAPAPVIDVAPAPVIEYIAPAPFAPSQQLLPAYTMATVTTDVSLDLTSLANPQCFIIAVEATAPQVVGLPLSLDESAAPMYNQARQEQIAAEQDRVQQHTVEQIVHVPVPLIQEQFV